jgi:hypothetical protein
MRRGGCLEQIVELFLLTALFDWLQDRFGFGRGSSCTGCGCGLLLLFLFLFLACSIITSGPLILNPRGLGLLLGGG